MTETVILAAAQTAADSSDVVIPGGSSATIAIFATGGRKAIPGGVFLGVMKVDNGVEVSTGVALSRHIPAQVFGPGTYRVKRSDISGYGVNVGATSST